jgi:hypothetical protein
MAEALIRVGRKGAKGGGGEGYRDDVGVLEFYFILSFFLVRLIILFM